MRNMYTVYCKKNKESYCLTAEYVEANSIIAEVQETAKAAIITHDLNKLKKMGSIVCLFFSVLILCFAIWSL